MSGKGKTLKDLAAKLDISVATASRALAGHHRIASNTRERVAAAAREIGYVPNRAARALVSGRTGFAALALPVRGRGVPDHFLGAFVSGLAAGFGREGMDLVLTAVPEGEDEVAAIRALVEARRADGLVLARVAEQDPRVDYLLGRGFPFVAYGRMRDPDLRFSWLDTDGRAAFAEAFDLLHDLGHRRFGFVSIAEPMTFRRHRAAGLEDAIARRGDPAVRLVTVAAPRFDAAARAAAVRELLDRRDPPTAVIGLFDGLAVAVLEEATRRGLDVPGALSVVGFDDTPGVAHARPGLTTFDAGIHDNAVAIAGMLARRIAGGDAEPETRLVRPPLVLRGSHGPAPP